MENKLRKLKMAKLLHLAMEGISILTKISKLPKRKKRSCCVRKINRDRNQHGFFAVSFKAMKSLDSGKFFIYTRMTQQIFELLLNLMKPHLIKSSIRTPIQPECRLAVTLQFLAQGTSLQSLAGSFKLGKETVRTIVLETCEIVWNVLFPIYIKEPSNNDHTQTVEEFLSLWNMPNCVGSIGGKHIALKCPPSSQSQFSCHKKVCSIVLLAACDARYRFTFVDAGAYGSQGDRGVFQNSQIGNRLLENKLLIPPPNYLPGTQVKFPHYFVADAAFPLGINIMRPYPGTLLPTDKENFNKRLSRARLTIENCFGILVARWQILLNTLHMYPENAEKVVLACVALHNFVMFNNGSSYCPNNYTDWEDSDGKHQDGLWRSEIGGNLPSVSASNVHCYGGRSSIQLRNQLCKFLNQN